MVVEKEDFGAFLNNNIDNVIVLVIIVINITYM